MHLFTKPRTRLISASWAEKRAANPQHQQNMRDYCCSDPQKTKYLQHP